MLMQNMLSKDTDASRRLALQIAAQLPENVNEARTVLEESATLLGSFLIRSPMEPWRLSLPDLELSLAWRLVLAAGLFFALTPLACVLAYEVQADNGAAWILLVGVIVSTLVLGRFSGACFACWSAVALNFLIEPPAFCFTWPTHADVVRLAGWLCLAAFLPTLSHYSIAVRQWLTAILIKPAGATILTVMRSQG